MTIVRRGAVALAVLVLLVAGGASPARAVSGDCPVNRFCAWHQINYTGTMTVYYWTDVQNGVSLPGSGHNNTGSSWINRFTTNDTAHIVLLIDTDNCITTGVWYRQLNPGQAATAQGSDWNDRVSSYATWDTWSC
jgi:hypothetical protein